MELDACRTALQRLAEELSLPAGGGVGGIAVLLDGLLTRMQIAVRPTGDRGGVRSTLESTRTERSRRAHVLGTAADLGALRGAFAGEVDLFFDSMTAGAETSPAVTRARAFLDSNFDQRVSLQQVSGAVNLSPNYLSAIFRRETGMTVTEYLRWRRTRMAERLLLEGKHTISEIAYLVGYQNYRDFHRNFVRVGGRSPRAFQQMCRTRRRSVRRSLSPPPTD